jgi:maltose O-acetyltransferase
MNIKVFLGSLASYLYNYVIGYFPICLIRKAYLRIYLAQIGKGTVLQIGCRFLNGRRVYLGRRNVINFACLFDG